MKADWVDVSLELAKTPASFYSGARKIIRNHSFTFKRVRTDLTLADCGFTKSKQTMLVKNYLNEESRDAAVMLWKRRIDQDKYGSVGFSTYNHFVKGHGLKKLEGGKVNRASVMGPCIQSVTLTLLPSRKVAIDIFYRTTELFKKFPADLVFIRDVLLPPFHTSDGLQEINFHFANITCHPMYFVTLIPLLGADVVHELEGIRKADKKFFEWVVKWTARYVCPEHMRGIQKFAQAMRVKQDAMNRIPPNVLKGLRKYLNDHHPGYRNEYTAPEEDEE